MPALFAILTALVSQGGPLSPLSAADAPDPPVVRIVSTEFAFKLPDRVPAGAVTFHLVNEGAEPHHAWIVRFDGDHDLADYMEASGGGTRMPRCGPSDSCSS